jgi:hypothetical protein
MKKKETEVKDVPAKPKPPKFKKKYVKKKIVKDIPCQHCGVIFHYPVVYCNICKMHIHQAIESIGPDGACGSCSNGLTRQGQAFQRAAGTWSGARVVPGAYDFPEWYDMGLEISGSTTMPLWINYEVDNVY